jgi:hypothetical protein
MRLLIMLLTVALAVLAFLGAGSEWVGHYSRLVVSISFFVAAVALSGPWLPEPWRTGDGAARVLYLVFLIFGLLGVLEPLLTRNGLDPLKALVRLMS